MLTDSELKWWIEMIDLRDPIIMGNLTSELYASIDDNRELWNMVGGKRKAREELIFIRRAFRLVSEGVAEAINEFIPVTEDDYEALSVARDMVGTFSQAIRDIETLMNEMDRSLSRLN